MKVAGRGEGGEIGGGGGERSGGEGGRGFGGGGEGVGGRGGEKEVEEEWEEEKKG